MSQPIQVLYIGPKDSRAFDTASLKQQSRAIRLAGGSLARYQGSSASELAARNFPT